MYLVHKKFCELNGQAVKLTMVLLDASWFKSCHEFYFCLSSILYY